MSSPAARLDVFQWSRGEHYGIHASQPHATRVSSCIELLSGQWFSLGALEVGAGCEGDDPSTDLRGAPSAFPVHVDISSHFNNAVDMIPPSTRLRRALHLRSIALVRRIILSNPSLIRNPDPDDRCNTSLHLAAQLGLLDIADFLLSLGHESEGISRNLDGLTPLMIAGQAGADEDNDIVAGRLGIGKLLIAQFPDALMIKDKQGMDAFAHAARHGTTTLLSHLLSLPHPSSNTFITTTDNLRNTPLHHGSAAGHLKAVRILVDAGADPLARNAAMWTPIDFSATVSAEVYLKNLSRERMAMRSGSGVVGRAASPGKGRSTVRLVGSERGGSDEEGEGEMVIGRAKMAT